VRQGDGGSDDHDVAWFRCQVEDKALRDLDTVDGEAAEIFERRIAAAKIVNCDAQAGFAQAQ